MTNTAPTVFQSFTETSAPDQGPPRIRALQDMLRDKGIAAHIVPRADVYQGEYVAPNDERLAWLTGFTGSAGFCVVTQTKAALFVDGRYRTQAREQVDTDVIVPVDWPETKLADWLIDTLPDGGEISYDGWLHTADEIETLRAGLDGKGFRVTAWDSHIDTLWTDRGDAPVGPLRVHPDDLSGEDHASKRARLAKSLREAGQTGAVITLPDSIAWLLNIRGSDIPRNPVPHAFAILQDDARVTLFVNDKKLNPAVCTHLANDVQIEPTDAFQTVLTELPAPLRVDKSSAPDAVHTLIQAAGKSFEWGQDPCILPKACKNDVEIGATRTAHLRDAAAMCNFLSWFDAQVPGSITEIDVVSQLEAYRRDTGKLLDISFDTIAGSGPHGALPHYRVSTTSNRTLQAGELLVLDSGGQYGDGTTDITRTLPIGDAGPDERAAFTRVLQGMIAMSRVRWPRGLAGRDLDAIARYPLWLAGQDYDHGTGHGVGAHLCVHEGPQRLSRTSTVPLQPGMILSNEPGYYREGAFGIRIENLVVVSNAPSLPGGDNRDMLCFDTLNFVPIDRRLIDMDTLGANERAWLNDYHAQCRSKIAPLVQEEVKAWLDAATAPL
ncbi:MAG: aminopeptidase P family protein [Pseudomonadota bacterium]